MGVGSVRLRHLDTVTAEADIRLELAYDVARSAAEAVMASEGYRAAGGENHQTIFAFLERAADGRWAEAAAFFDRSRALRRLSVYGQNGAVSGTEADEMVCRASAFWSEVAEWLAQRHTASPERDTPR